MLKQNSELFDLVKTLSPSERRYFVLYSKRHFSKDTSYLLLFKAIQSLDNYDEKLLMQLFSKSKWLKHFAIVKKQLYYTLLEALHQFDEHNNIEQSIKKGIHYCALLLKKGLFTQCQKLLVKYKAAAYELEKFELVLELIEIEKKLINKALIHKEDAMLIESVDLEESKCLEQIVLSAKYWKQSSIVYKLHYQKKLGAGEGREELNTLLKNKDFSDYSLAKTTKAKLDFLQINALSAFINKDTKTAFENNKKFLDYLDQHEKMRIIHADRYFSVLNNYLIDSLILRKYDLLKEGIAQIRSIAKLSGFKHISNIEANVFRLSYTLELNYYVSQQLFKEGLAIIPLVEKGLKKQQHKIIKPSVITMKYLMAYVLFFSTKYESCLDQLNDILNDKEAVSIKDIYRDARMLQIICHFELKNYNLSTSLIVSFQRFLTKEKLSFKTYGAILKFMTAYIKDPFKDKRDKLLVEIKELEKSGTEAIVFNNFNYSLWLSR